METLFNDLKHGFRMLVHHPGFTVAVILALALGIGANTAVFSVMNAVLFDPLPYKDPDHIVSIAGRFTGIGLPDDRNQISAPELLDLRRFSTSFSDIAAVQGSSYNIRFWPNARAPLRSGSIRELLSSPRHRCAPGTDISTLLS
ncbi:MAG: hypothetical protein HY646_03670 [Acidobacteria bacterium]|nr:hypothetical protein [Acidobacteriota bacterium]